MSAPTLPAGTNAAQVAGTGSVVSIGGPASSAATYVPILNIHDVTLPNHKTDVTDSTTFNSGGIKQKIATLTDLGQLSFTCMRISGDPGQTQVLAALYAKIPYWFKIQLPANTLLGQGSAGDTEVYTGYVTEAGGYDVSLDKPSMLKFTVEVNSHSYTAGS